jgi:FkbM family methyltransferase
MLTALDLRRLGNKLYERAFPIYRPLYSAYKAFADRGERRLIRTSLFPGAVVADVGANIGIYSRFFSRCVGPTGIVHAFEPSQGNFRRLHSATRKLQNVRLWQAAVGERSGESHLYLSDKLNVDHRAYPPEGESRDAVPIDVIALDDYFGPGDRVDWIFKDLSSTRCGAQTVFCTITRPSNLLSNCGPMDLDRQRRLGLT